MMNREWMCMNSTHNKNITNIRAISNAFMLHSRVIAKTRPKKKAPQRKTTRPRHVFIIIPIGK